MENLEIFGLFLKEKDYQSYKIYGSQKNGYSVYINNKKTNVSDVDVAKAKKAKEQHETQQHLENFLRADVHKHLGGEAHKREQ